MKLALLATFLCLAVSSVAAAPPRIAITFDDLPSHGALPPGVTRVAVAAAVIAALKDAHAPPVYGFINGLRTQDDPDSAPVLKLWRDAGLPLANHTWSHINLNTHSVREWETDLLRNEPLLVSLMGKRDWRWLRYPYLAEGDTLKKHIAVRTFLARHRYRMAGVTMSFDDYLWNDPYARCIAKGDDATIARMEAAWLAAAAGSLAYYRGLSQQLYGRDIAYVLLMHLGAFDARMMPRLLELYRSKDVRLVTLEEAQRDPFYRVDMNPRLAPGPVSLEQAMHARGVTFPSRVVQVLPFDTLCR